MRLLLLLTLLAAPAFAQKVHRLKAAKEKVQWGWLDLNQPDRRGNRSISRADDAPRRRPSSFLR
jgi:hypothetical protein